MEERERGFAGGRSAGRGWGRWWEAGGGSPTTEKNLGGKNNVR
ncbi:hypothetical protein TIFTF001_018855 [Ficus carica]|uniref:Uncharacterized protein n=1 Tax=Ficus carica TaxID=3494 RepID=A0AA88AVZ6_FICCA|nr:hypothetical protein TIFTF001_018855 [Ficus carica]